ncbi:MAG: cytochrome-c peroxidase [Myxococcota bacterium]
MGRWKSVVIVLVASLALSACKKSEEAKETSPEDEAEQEQQEQTQKDPHEKASEALGAFEPLPEQFESEDNEITPAKVELGRMLYYENRLSKSQDLSCNTCHQLEKGGIDPRPASDGEIAATSMGHDEQRGARNSPTVYNAAGQFRQFWDGRAADVEEQAKGPITNPIEMGMGGSDEAVTIIKSIPGYQDKFAEVFPDQEEPISFDNMAIAIGAFERKLVTPSKWDAYLEGDEEALSDEEIRGFNTFVDAGCMSCHNGALVGGQTYQKLGLVEPWPNQKDKGRFEVTEDQEDLMKFKVPTLRNITKTGPYFHDGSVESLEEAVRLMAKHQVGRELTDEEVDSIVTWLETLDGEISEEYIARPKLPESGPKTPKAPDQG